MVLNVRAKAIIAGALEAGLQGRKLVRREDFNLTFDNATTVAHGGSPGAAGSFAINYLHTEGYHFSAQIYSGQSVAFQVNTREAPGGLTLQDERSYQGESAMKSGVLEWLTRLDDEIAALPTVRRLEELAQRISDIEDAIKDLPDTHLTREEADVLRRRMDDLEAKWTVRMRETEGKEADLEERISKLHAEMEMLKQVLDTATVRGLARLVAVRVWRYAKSPETPQQIATACESVKALTDGVTTMFGGA